MQICKPICAASTRSGRKIIGFSELKNFQYIVHYYEKQSDNFIQYSKRLNLIFPRFYCVTSVEMNSEGNIFYLAGLTNEAYNSQKGASPGVPMIAACEMEEGVGVVTWMEISNSKKFGLPTRIRRVKGTEILLVGCKKHIIVFEYLNKKFEKIEILNDIHENQICDFEFHKKTIYSKALNESRIVIIDLGVENLGNLDLDSSDREQFKRPAITRISYNLKNKEKIPVKEGGKLEKVAVTENGKVIYTGGEGFNILRYEEKKYKPFYTDRKKSKNFVLIFFQRKFLFLFTSHYKFTRNHSRM